MFVEDTELEQRVRVRRALKRIAGGDRAMRVVDVHDVDEGLVIEVVVVGRYAMCPCGTASRSVYDHRDRRWRHLDAGGVRVWLQTRVRRIDCLGCGRVRTEQVPWARPGARHTRVFENQLAWLVQRCDKTTVASLLRVSWKTVGAIVARVVDDHLGADRLEGLRRIGVDEISYRKGHRYLTVVVDHDRAAVVWVAEGKSKRSLNEFFDALGEDRCRQLEAISMDMGPAYIAAAQARAPQATICLDPFHVMQWAGRALDTAFAAVTRGQHGLKLKGRDRTRTRFTLRRGAETLTAKQRAAVEDLRELRWELFRAWELKERLRDVYRVGHPQARAHLADWFDAARESGIRPMVNLADQLQRHTEGILASIQHRLSNARVEGLNGRIRLIHRRGYGYHSAAALTALIYLCCSRIAIPPPTRT